MAYAQKNNMNEEHEAHMAQLNGWLEEYRNLAETRDRENFALKLQIAQLYTDIKTKDKNELAQQAYIVELEETVRVLGDELELAAKQLQAKELESRRLARTTNQPIASLEHADNEDELLQEICGLHEENQALQERVSELEELLNNEQSANMDLRIRLQTENTSTATDGTPGTPTDRPTDRPDGAPSAYLERSTDRPTDRPADTPSAYLEGTAADDSLAPLELKDVSLAPLRPRSVSSPSPVRRRHSESDDEGHSPVALKISRDLSTRGWKDWKEADPRRGTTPFQGVLQAPRRTQSYFNHGISSPDRTAQWSPERGEDSKESPPRPFGRSLFHEQHAAHPPKPPSAQMLRYPNREDLPTPPRVHPRRYGHK